MSDFKIITQAELLTKSRELRDRVEISLHKLGPGAKSFQQNLNSIVAGLSVQNAHPVDDKQPSLFDSPRVGQPRRTPKRKLTLAKPSKAFADAIKAERAAAGRTNTLMPKSTVEVRDRALRKFLMSGQQSTWTILSKHGATLADIEEAWAEMANVKEAKGVVKSNGCTFTYDIYACRIWWDKDISSGTADIANKLLFQTIARVLKIQILTPAQKRATETITRLSPKERKAIDKTTTDVNCSKCNGAFPKSEMKRTAGRRLVCKSCAKTVAKTSGITTNKSGESVKRKAPKKVAKKIAPRAEFMQPMQATPELQAIVGTKPMPRTDVTKKIWDYIKKNNLQDKANRRNINVDEALGKIFANKKGAVPKQVSMFEMTKLVTRHLTPVKA